MARYKKKRYPTYSPGDKVSFISSGGYGMFTPPLDKQPQAYGVVISTKERVAAIQVVTPPSRQHPILCFRTSPSRAGAPAEVTPYKEPPSDKEQVLRA